MQRIFKYPKLTLLAATFVFAYFLYAAQTFLLLRQSISEWGYIGALVAGILYVFGLTAAPATAIFLLMADHYNIVVLGILGGLGSLLGDFMIFKLIRYSFADEIRTLFQERIVHYFTRRVPHALRKMFIPLVAGFIIASPLPDEVGVFLLAASPRVTSRFFAMLCYVLNTAGIFVILGIGRAV